MLTFVVPEDLVIHIDVVDPLNPNGILFGLDVRQSFCEKSLIPGFNISDAQTSLSFRKGNFFPSY